MCLIAIDGTYSFKFNSRSLGKDASGYPIGVLDSGMSNTYRFFVSSGYPRSEKFYFGGPRAGATGSDSGAILSAVLDLIEQGSCREVSLVGWSRGAVIASEVAEILHYGKRRVVTLGSRGSRFKGYRDIKHRPEVRFVGLFDSVSMNWTPPVARAPNDDTVGWGEELPNSVKYVAHVLAGDRSGPVQPVPLPFFKAAPNVTAKQSFELVIAHATHADVGGMSHTAKATQAYRFIRGHATKAGVP